MICKKLSHILTLKYLLLRHIGIYHKSENQKITNILQKRQFHIIKEIHRINKYLLIKTRSDKCRTVVIIDRDAYQQKVMEVLCTKIQITKLYRDPTDVYQNKIQQQYTVYCDMRYSLSWTDHIGTYIVRNVCIHKLENMNSWDLNNTRGTIMLVVITAVLTVLVSSCDCNILRYLMTGRVTGT